MSDKQTFRWVRVGRTASAKVDIADYEMVVAAGPWCVAGDATHRYAKASHLSLVAPGVRMHRFIMQAPDDLVVDHINHDTLDNRRHNLRLCTSGNNIRNQTKSRYGKSTSRHKGVSWKSANEKWAALITINGTRRMVGGYPTQDEAAQAYNVGASFVFGEYAHLNDVDPLFPDESETSRVQELITFWLT